MRLLLCFAAALLGLLCAGAAAAATPGDGLHYDVSARFAPSAGTVAVDLTISLPRMEPGQTITFVLGKTYVLSKAEAGRHGSVLVAGTDKPWPGLQGITVSYVRAVARPRLRLVYEGPLNPTGDDPINLITPGHIEVSLDGMWMPIRDDLQGEFTATARISGLPRHAIVVSQGEVKRRGSQVLLSRSFPSIDLPFVASPSLRLAQEKDFSFYAADPEDAEARRFRQHGQGSMEFLKAWLGPLRGSAPRLVMVQRPRKSGYARRGYVVVVASGATGSERGIAQYIAHEFGHLWFSNANAATDHRWLDESATDYAALRYVEASLGLEARDRILAAKRKTAAATGPLLGGKRDDAELYAKGPVLLFDLEERIGRERMDRLIAALASGRIKETPQFLATLAAIASADDASWFEQRLRS